MSGFKSKNFNIPEGIEYYMAGEAKIFEKLKRNISSIYTKSKYSYVITPIFDNLDNLLSLKSTDLDNQTTFVLDKINRTEVGIRADITPQIAKVDYQLTGGKGKSKYCYMGDILRLSPGPFDRINPFQTGVEYFGIKDKSADIEIIKLMIDIISLSKEQKIIIELGDLCYLNNLINELNLDMEKKIRLVNLINLKSTDEIKNFFNENNLSKNKKKFLLDLISLSGDISVMKELKKVMKYNKVKNFTALNNLESIAQIIQKYKSNCDIQIDLCELHGLNYQSSLAYTAYIPNLRKEIARGGRYLAYDTYSNNPRTATGFSLDIKDLLDILLQKRPYHV